MFSQDYSNRVPVALKHPVKSRLPSASKIWIILLLSKLLALVRCNVSVASNSGLKIAFRSIGVTHSSSRVILTAWLALPNTVFGPLTGIATWWDPIAGVSAALMEGLDTRK